MYDEDNFAALIAKKIRSDYIAEKKRLEQSLSKAKERLAKVNSLYEKTYEDNGILSKQKKRSAKLLFYLFSRFYLPCASSSNPYSTAVCAIAPIAAPRTAGSRELTYLKPKKQ